MGKGVTTITVDSNILDYHRAKGTNVSKTVNDYLQALMGDEVDTKDFEGEISQLEADLAKARLEKKQAEQVIKTQAEGYKKAGFRSDILRLAELNKERGNSLHATKLFAEGMQAAKVKYDLHMSELLAFVEGTRRLPE